MTEFVLAGGCFWCLDSSYSQFKGVIDVVCGYAGGHKENPTYEEVCGEGTGHAEVAKIIFDENIISSDFFNIPELEKIFHILKKERLHHRNNLRFKCMKYVHFISLC